jgi:hypothetical protein
LQRCQRGREHFSFWQCSRWTEENARVCRVYVCVWVCMYACVCVCVCVCAFVGTIQHRYGEEKLVTHCYTAREGVRSRSLDPLPPPTPTRYFLSPTHRLVRDPLTHSLVGLLLTPLARSLSSNSAHPCPHMRTYALSHARKHALNSPTPTHAHIHALSRMHARTHARTQLSHARTHATLSYQEGIGPFSRPRVFHLKVAHGRLRGR